jgi:hypothetical protein
MRKPQIMDFPNEIEILRLGHVLEWRLSLPRVSRYFWKPDERVVTAVVNWASEAGAVNVVELGADLESFPMATTQLNVKEEPNTKHIDTIIMDADEDVIPRADHYFDFAYSRHTLEDLQNPSFAFKELTRVAPRGYIETPSPLIECLRHIDHPAINDAKHRGFIHHRYFVWTEVEDNSLHFLPKFPIVEDLIMDPRYDTIGAAIASDTPFAWNNFYTWSPDKPPKCVMHKPGVNFQIMETYGALIQRGISESFNATKVFARDLCHLDL